MKTVIVKKGSVIESDFGTVHEALADFGATLLERQQIDLDPYYICLYSGKISNESEEPFLDLGFGQLIFVYERDMVRVGERRGIE